MTPKFLTTVKRSTIAALVHHDHTDAPTVTSAVMNAYLLPCSSVIAVLGLHFKCNRFRIALAYRILDIFETSLHGPQSNFVYVNESYAVKT